MVPFDIVNLQTWHTKKNLYIYIYSLSPLHSIKTNRIMFSIIISNNKDVESNIQGYIDLEYVIILLLFDIFSLQFVRFP